MIARIKKTGKLIDMVPYGDEFAQLFPGGDFKVYTKDELDFRSDINWQHYRIQAAIAAMQGMLANSKHHDVQVESGVPFSNFYAINAVMCADALVVELKKGDEQ